MDDYGNSLGIAYDQSRNPCCRAWTIFHFYGLIGPGGCIHVACREYIDLRAPYNHH